MRPFKVGDVVRYRRGWAPETHEGPPDWARKCQWVVSGHVPEYPHAPGDAVRVTHACSPFCFRGPRDSYDTETALAFELVTPPYLSAAMVDCHDPHAAVVTRQALAVMTWYRNRPGADPILLDTCVVAVPLPGTRGECSLNEVNSHGLTKTSRFGLTAEQRVELYAAGRLRIDWQLPETWTEVVLLPGRGE